jgi:hypothetical protein
MVRCKARTGAPFSPLQAIPMRSGGNMPRAPSPIK